MLNLVTIIGVGRFWLFGGARFIILEGGGLRGDQIPSRHMTSKRRRCYVTTSHRRHFDVMCPQDFNKSVPNDYISHLKI